MPADHPDFGKALPCRCAAAEEQAEQQARLERYSNLGPLRGVAFAALDPGRTEAFAAALEQARVYARAPQGWLLIWGRSGSGKTALAAAMANDRIARGDPALYMVTPDLLDHLRAGYQEDADTPYARLFEQVRNAPFLILDDIDSANATPWAEEKFFQLCNHRFNAALPTVVLSCVPPRDLPERLATRLLNADRVTTLALDGAAGGAYRQIGGMTQDRLALLTLDRFKPEGRGLLGEEAANLQRALRTARLYARQPDGWLVLLGGHGCGKTHLAAAIAGERLAAGDRVCFAVVPDLLDHLRATFNPQHPVTYDDLFEEIRSVGLLVLDDLGAHHTSPWAEEKLYQIISYRYINRLPTVITTNLNPSDLPPRLASRMLDSELSTAFRVLAPDYRTGALPRDRESGLRGPASPGASRPPRDRRRG